MIKNNSIKLSKRLKMIADMVPIGTNFADIGADHGYLIKYLKENDLINFAYASDNKKGPYERLKKNLEGLDIKVDLASGIRNLPHEINCLCIAGMGGDNIISICKEAEVKLSQLEYIVISSHGLIEEVRKYLFEHGFSLINQDACFDEEPYYYEVNLFKHEAKEYDEIDIKYGKFLIKNKNYCFFTNIKNNILNIQKILTKPISEDKILSLMEQLQDYYKILELLE